MLVSEFAYDLPADLIAQTPAEPRDAARLMVYDRQGGRIEHTVFSKLPKFLSAGDLVVLNNTRVLPWRLVGQRATGGRVEVLILARKGELASGYVNPARKLRTGERVSLEGGALEMEILGDTPDAGVLQFRLTPATGGPDLAETLEAAGRAPLPPYIRRQDEDLTDDLRRADRARYQTIFAEEPGAVAAPTAGLHFTPAVFDALAAAGATLATVTLHVGPGTFLPVRAKEVAQHQMHGEHYHLPADAAEQVNATRAAGGRVVAVGTTATRTLESCAQADGTVTPGTGTTDLFLYPGRQFRVVDTLLTNFHLPESTLLMLVAAFIGREKILELYREAIERRYRFYSYGDAMLLV